MNNAAQYWNDSIGETNYVEIEDQRRIAEARERNDSSSEGRLQTLPADSYRDTDAQEEQHD